MASAATAISTTLVQLKPPPVALAFASSSSAVSTLPCFPRRSPSPRSLTTACPAAVETPQGGAVVRKRRRDGIQHWTTVPISDIRPATEDRSIFLITLDLRSAPDLVDAYTTPGQFVMTRVPSPDEMRSPSYFCISSPPRSGLQFDLLVRSVPGTTSEQLCSLQVGDFVELGPVMGRGFALQYINPPAAAETVLLFAVAEGVSPIRALIDYGFGASERADVTLYLAAPSLQSMPYQDRFKKWEETGVKVVPLTHPIQGPLLECILDEKIVNPISTGAVMVTPQTMKEDIIGGLLDHGVPHDKILTMEWNPVNPFPTNA